MWVASFPAFDRRRRVSRNGGGQAMWRGDGRELFYLTPQGQMMSVKVTPAADGSLEFAAAAELFQTPQSQPILTIDQYAVTADGQRFLIVRPARRRHVSNHNAQRHRELAGAIGDADHRKSEAIFT